MVPWRNGSGFGILFLSYFRREAVMTPTMKDLGIDRLSPQQRVALALEIWESLGDARPTAQLTPAQRTELARRDAELDANPGMALTWEQIRAAVETEP
jgi:putative addiction module component (TIGR02574 family)